MRCLMVTSLAVTAVFVAMGITACKGDSKDRVPDPPSETLPAPVNEDELARTLLLTLADFPTGWAEEADSEESSPFDECKPETPTGQTGRGETGTFSNDSSSGIAESIALFTTPEETNAAVEDRLSSIGDCITDVVRQGKLDDDKATYSDPSFSPLSFPDHGDRTDAYRLKIHASANGETGLGSEADVYVDIVNVVVGRAVYSFNATDVFSPFDSDELDGYVTKAEEKIRTGLADSSRGNTQQTPRAAVTPTPKAQNHVGDRLETTSGSSLFLTVHSYEAPVSSEDQFISPDVGKTFASVDVEACTSPDLRDPASVNPFDLSLQLPDNTRLSPDFSAREPALNATDLLADDCVRGFVTFQVPNETTPRYVVYEGYGPDFKPVTLKWALGP